jgi:hypothetical protein
MIGTEETPLNDVGRRQSKTAGTKATPLKEVGGAHVASFMASKKLYLYIQ